MIVKLAHDTQHLVALTNHHSKGGVPPQARGILLRKLPGTLLAEKFHATAKDFVEPPEAPALADARGGGKVTLQGAAGEDGCMGEQVRVFEAQPGRAITAHAELLGKPALTAGDRAERRVDAGHQFAHQDRLHRQPAVFGIAPHAFSKSIGKHNESGRHQPLAHGAVKMGRQRCHPTQSATGAVQPVEHREGLDFLRRAVLRAFCVADEGADACRQWRPYFKLASSSRILAVIFTEASRSTRLVPSQVS
jgi:hypothetical protein